MYAVKNWTRSVEGLRSQLLELQTLLERGPTELPASDLQVLMHRLRTLVGTARASGLFAYASIALRILERVEPHARSGQLPTSRREVISRWIAASQGYLLDPHSRACALQLVDHLATEPGESGCADEEVNGLLCDLLQEPIAPSPVARPRLLNVVR
jgi:hypothetical protein